MSHMRLKPCEAVLPSLGGRDSAKALQVFLLTDQQGMQMTSPETSNEILQPTEICGLTEPAVQIDNSSEATCRRLPSMVSKP